MAMLITLQGPEPGRKFPLETGCTILGRQYDAQGNLMYEGTPVHLLILPGGLFVGVAIHSIISYFILCAAFKRHADQS